MGDQTLPCGETAVNPASGEVVACTEPKGHSAVVHVHGRPPHRMSWPAGQDVTCPAWRRDNTALGPTVVRCVIPARRHRPLEHEGRIGIHTLPWSDADVNAAGRVARDINSTIVEYQPGQLMIPNSRLANFFQVAPETVAAAMHLLARDGVIRRDGRRWRKT